MVPINKFIMLLFCLSLSKVLILFFKLYTIVFLKSLFQATQHLLEHDESLKSSQHLALNLYADSFLSGAHDPYSRVPMSNFSDEFDPLHAPPSTLEPNPYTLFSVPFIGYILDVDHVSLVPPSLATRTGGQSVDGLVNSSPLASDRSFLYALTSAVQAKLKVSTEGATNETSSRQSCTNYKQGTEINQRKVNVATMNTGEDRSYKNVDNLINETFLEFRSLTDASLHDGGIRIQLDSSTSKASAAQSRQVEKHLVALSAGTDWVLKGSDKNREEPGELEALENIDSVTNATSSIINLVSKTAVVTCAPPLLTCVAGESAETTSKTPIVASSAKIDILNCVSTASEVLFGPIQPSRHLSIGVLTGAVNAPPLPGPLEPAVPAMSTMPYADLPTVSVGSIQTQIVMTRNSEEGSSRALTSAAVTTSQRSMAITNSQAIVAAAIHLSDATVMSNVQTAMTRNVVTMASNEVGLSNAQNQEASAAISKSQPINVTVVETIEEPDVLSDFSIAGNETASLAAQLPAVIPIERTNAACSKVKYKTIPTQPMTPVTPSVTVIGTSSHNEGTPTAVISSVTVTPTAVVSSATVTSTARVSSLRSVLLSAPDNRTTPVSLLVTETCENNRAITETMPLIAASASVSHKAELARKLAHIIDENTVTSSAATSTSSVATVSVPVVPVSNATVSLDTVVKYLSAYNEKHAKKNPAATTRHMGALLAAQPAKSKLTITIGKSVPVTRRPTTKYATVLATSGSAVTPPAVRFGVTSQASPALLLSCTLSTFQSRGWILSVFLRIILI